MSTVSSFILRLTLIASIATGLQVADSSNIGLLFWKRSWGGPRKPPMEVGNENV
jgi:hypothetical protein